MRNSIFVKALVRAGLIICISSLFGCQTIQPRNKVQSESDKIKTLVTLLTHSEGYSVFKAEELNREMGKNFPTIRQSLENKMGRSLTEAEHGKLAAIIRGSIDASFEEALEGALEKGIRDGFTTDEVEDALHFYESTAGKKLLQGVAKFGASSSMPDFLEPFKQRTAEKILSGMKQEMPYVLDAIAPPPPRPGGNWFSTCPRLNEPNRGGCVERLPKR